MAVATEAEHVITGMSVATPELVYAWPKSKEEFDKIDAEETVHEWCEDVVSTVTKRDGHQYERRCHSKTVNGKVMVVFQWFEVRRVGA